MAKMVTVTDLENGKVDLKTVDEAANEEKMVRSRWGGVFRSIPLVSRELYDNGGWRGFANEAELKAYRPTVLNSITKDMETKKLWRWTGSEWKDEGKSDLDLANSYTDDQLKEISAVNVGGAPIIQVEDSNGNITLKQTTDAHLHVPHLDESIQDSINSFKGLVTAEKSENLIEVYDDNGNIVLRQSSDGDLRWAGSEQSLNQRLNSSSSDDDLLQIKDENEDVTLVKIDKTGDFVNSQVPEGLTRRLTSGFLSPKSNHTAKSKRFLIREDALHVINSNRALASSIAAPVPLDQIPLNYTPPKSLLNLTVSQPEPTVLDSPYRKNDGFVHPHLVQFHTSLNGCKYWLAITGFKDGVDYLENPFVYGSHDLINFKLFADYPQPLVEKPAQTRPRELSYNSDVFQFYDFQSCEFCIGWRTSHYLPEETILHTGIQFKSTKDGVHWSDIRTLMHSSTDNEKLLSPTIIYDFVNNRYLMFAVDPVNPDGTGRKEIVRYECRYLGDTWINKTIIDTPRTFLPWHLEVRYLGDSIALHVNDIYQARNNFLGLSSDNGETFEFGVAILESGALHSYKSTFTPIINEQDNTIALNFMWNSSQFNKEDVNDQWLTFSQKTKFVNLEGN